MAMARRKYDFQPDRPQTSLLDKLYICPHCGRKLPLRSEGLTEAIKAQCPRDAPIVSKPSRLS